MLPSSVYTCAKSGIFVLFVDVQIKRIYVDIIIICCVLISILCFIVWANHNLPCLQIVVIPNCRRDHIITVAFIVVVIFCFVFLIHVYALMNTLTHVPNDQIVNTPPLFDLGRDFLLFYLCDTAGCQSFIYTYSRQFADVTKWRRRLRAVPVIDTRNTWVRELESIALSSGGQVTIPR